MNRRDQYEAETLEFLRAQLGDRAPQRVIFEHAFSEAPLEGEGPAAVVSFELAPEAAGPCPGEANDFYAVVGETQPNYYPSYGLTPDDVYSLHIGTRFMLEMGLQRTDNAVAPPEALSAVRGFLIRHVPEDRIKEIEVELVMRGEDAVWVVYRVTIGEQRFFCPAGDCPTGCYEMTEHPPQVALRLHLGKIIRAEPAEEDGE